GVGTAAVVAPPGAAVGSPLVRMVPEPRQRPDAVAGDEYHPATPTTGATVGTATRPVLLAVEGHGAVTAAPRRHLHPRFVDEHAPNRNLRPGAGPSRGSRSVGGDHGRIIAVKIARAVAVTLCLVQLGVLCGACSASHKAAPRNPGPPASTGSAAGTLVVLASTQLKPAFEQLDTQFAAANPGVAVTATYQGSQALATAVQAGAQGDLFATD